MKKIKEKIQKFLTKQNIIIITISLVTLGLIMHLGGWNYLKNIFGSRAGGVAYQQAPGEIPKDISQFKEPNGCRKFYPWGAPLVSDPEVNKRSLYMCRSSYAVQYDTKIKVPLWQIEILQKANVVAFNVPASFVPTLDPELPNTLQAKLEDYTNNRYEFGFLASIKNMYINNDSMTVEQLEDINQKSLKESLYITNAIPQTRLSKQMTDAITEDARKLINDKSPLYIISGPVFLNGQTNGFIGDSEDKIAVPTHIFKIITYPHSHGSVAYLIPNQQQLPCGNNCAPNNFMTSIKEVERVTGITFYPELTNFYSVQVKHDINEIFKPKK